jgi:hypothetical protein
MLYENAPRPRIGRISRNRTSGVGRPVATPASSSAIAGMMARSTQK